VRQTLGKFPLMTKRLVRAPDTRPEPGSSARAFLEYARAAVCQRLDVVAPRQRPDMGAPDRRLRRHNLITT
jgi:hypothetical protein